MPAVREDRHLITQCRFELFDRCPVDEDIIGVVHDMDLRIAAEPIKNGCQGSSFGKALEIGWRLGEMLRPRRERKLFGVLFKSHVPPCTEAFPGRVFGWLKRTLILYAVRDIGELGQRRLQGRSNKELDVFGCETRELLCQPAKDRWVV